MMNIFCQGLVVELSVESLMGFFLWVKIVNNNNNIRSALTPEKFCSTVKVVPIIIGALGTFPKGLEEWLWMIWMSNLSKMLQRACLLGSARVLRKCSNT